MQTVILIKNKHEPDIILNKLSFRPYYWAMAQMVVQIALILSKLIWTGYFYQRGDTPIKHIYSVVFVELSYFCVSGITFTLTMIFDLLAAMV